MEQFSWYHVTFIYHQNPPKSGKGIEMVEYKNCTASDFTEFLHKIFLFNIFNFS